MGRCSTLAGGAPNYSMMIILFFFCFVFVFVFFSPAKQKQTIIVFYLIRDLIAIAWLRCRRCPVIIIRVFIFIRSRVDIFLCSGSRGNLLVAHN